MENAPIPLFISPKFSYQQRRNEICRPRARVGQQFHRNIALKLWFFHKWPTVISLQGSTNTWIGHFFHVDRCTWLICRKTAVTFYMRGETWFFLVKPNKIFCYVKLSTNWQLIRPTHLKMITFLQLDEKILYKARAHFSALMQTFKTVINLHRF